MLKYICRAKEERKKNMKIRKILAGIIFIIIILGAVMPTVALAENEINTANINNTNIDTQTSNVNNNTSEKNNENKTNGTNTTIENNSVNETTNNTINNEVQNKTELTTFQKEENTRAIQTAISVSYKTHVQDEGWQAWKTDGELAGTSGKSLRLEALNIKLLNNKDENLKIKYQVHVQNEGWQDWKKDGELAGTSGKSLRLEGIKIGLENSEDYSIMYRVHVQNEGWQDWKTDGELAGTIGKSLRLEAIQIKVVEKKIKSTMCIDAPQNGKTYYSNETTNIDVAGWKMVNVSNTYIKAYINGKEIEEKAISYIKRPDVINAITDYGTEKQNPTPGYKFSVNISELKSGNNTIKIEVYHDSDVLITQSTSFNIDTSPHVQYKTHVQNEGWQDWKTDGELAGTSGKGLRLEALNIKLLNNKDENLKIKYQVHVQNEGWQDWKTDGALAGTSGKSLRLEGIKISLENSEDYSIMYRVHVQNEGWQDWKTDGELAGTIGKSLRLEALQIKIVKRQIKSTMCIDAPQNGKVYYNNETTSINVAGWKMANISNTYIKAYLDDKEIDSKTINYTERPDVIKAITDYGTASQNPKPGYNFNVDISALAGGKHIIKIEVYHNDNILTTQSTSFNIDTAPHVKYSAHVQNIGWQDYTTDGENIGTIGQGLRVETLKIQLVNVPATAHIKYKAYIEGTGWTSYVKDGEQLGTTGQNKKIEAVQIEIEGLSGYTVEYRAHVQNIGWQQWGSNGMEVGTTGQELRIEALKVRLTKSENTVVPQVKYSSHNATSGWTSYIKNGSVSGNENNAIKLDAIKIALENSGTASIKYKVHVQEIGWMDELQNNAQAGTGESVNGIEAIQIELSGLSGYSIEYRVYVIGKGWQDWVCDGEMAGTTGEGVQIGAIQIRIKIKTDSNKSNFSSIDTSKYKGYKEALQKLQQQHPNWTIKLVYTGLKWEDVLNAEQGRDSKGEPYSLTQATGSWRDSSDNNSYQGEWYKASREAIAYMMDPRNSLDQYYVFQFQNLARSSNETVQKVSTMTNGTYLQNYSSTLVSASQSYNVSAFHLASRMLMEQGTSGWSINGYAYNGRTVYNYANIGATGSTLESIKSSGAAYAYKNHWFTPKTCINGTAQWIYNNYLSNGQNTKYFEKYNVVKQPFYTHQYMQNIRAANDEGYNTAKSLEKNGLLNSSYEFLIPVYEGMPDTACVRP